MSTKQYILKMRKEINNVISNDKQCIEFKKELASQSKDITDTFKMIQALDEEFEDPKERTEMMMELNITMEDLNKLNKKTQEEYENHVSGLRTFKNFKERYPGLFKMFLAGDVNNEALNHCLDTFTLLENGAISAEQGKEMGWNKYQKSKFDKK